MISSAGVSTCQLGVKWALKRLPVGVMIRENAPSKMIERGVECFEKEELFLCFEFSQEVPSNQ